MNRDYIINNDKNRIEFLDKRYYFHEPSYLWLPSSTTLLEAYPKTAQFFEWLKKNGDEADTIRDEAGDVGSIVHNLTEMYDNGDIVSLIDTQNRSQYKQIAWAMFERYVDFSRRYMPDIVENELHLVDPELGYGGTLDRVVQFPQEVANELLPPSIAGKKFLIDIKTSGSIHNHFWLQLTSYLKLYERVRNGEVDGIAILWLNANTRTDGRKGSTQGVKWQLILPTETIEHYWKLFQCVKELWLEENKDYKPRNISYQLTHSKIKQWT